MVKTFRWNVSTKFISVLTALAVAITDKWTKPALAVGAWSNPPLQEFANNRTSVQSENLT
ncbi:MAG: hypothetical protein LDL41_18500 [Coleofasciculus sp. S288]|nr:hypothetical protein [Coleofasciculus sp. S288]